jgi:hypothetical protein
MNEERYVDCEVCDERFVGESAIRSYIQQVEVGTEVRDICISCQGKKSPTLIAAMQMGRAETVNQLLFMPDMSIRTHTLTGSYPIIYAGDGVAYCPACALEMEEAFYDDPEVESVPKLQPAPYYEGVVPCEACEKLMFGAYTSEESYGIGGSDA